MSLAAGEAAGAISDAWLETPRLVLRPIGFGDVPRCIEILVAGGGEGAREHAGVFREEVEHWAAHGFGPWVALHRESGDIVGTFDVNYAGPGLEGIDAGEVEVGWMVDPRLWRRGLATEGARVACNDAFRRAGTRELVAYIRPDNAPSLRVAEKLGMTYEGDGRSRDGADVRIFRMRR